ncbi:CoA-transferase, partial [Arthrobacter sp.]|uniref:CoA-transferase n=1 Tax=Arthrobacter sp. TaxID=1667 RepID=UPI003A8E0656
MDGAAGSTALNASVNVRAERSMAIGWKVTPVTVLDGWGRYKILWAREVIELAMDKGVASAAEAVADIGDGSSIAVGGFGLSGNPMVLIQALLEQGATELSV